MPTSTADRPEIDLPEKDRYTYDDYQQLPEGAPYELIRGELIMSPAPELQHQRVARRFFRALDGTVTKNDSGEAFFAPFDVHLSESTVLQPDLAFISTTRTDRLGEHAIEGAPDLGAEILSPATAHRDLTEKKRLYETHGVREYWIVDPNQATAEVFQNTDEGFIQHARVVHEGVASSTLLGDFAIELKDLF